MDDQNINPASPPLNSLPNQGQPDVSTPPDPNPTVDVGRNASPSSSPDISFPSEDSGSLPLTNEIPPSPDGTASPIPQESPIIPPSKPKLSLGKGKIVATILGILLLVGGVGAGIVLVQQQQDIREKAAESVSCTGSCTCKLLVHDSITQAGTCGGSSCGCICPNGFAPQSSSCTSGLSKVTTSQEEQNPNTANQVTNGEEQNPNTQGNVQSCKADGQDCTSPSDCCSKICAYGKCSSDTSGKGGGQDEKCDNQIDDDLDGKTDCDDPNCSTDPSCSNNRITNPLTCDQSQISCTSTSCTVGSNYNQSSCWVTHYVCDDIKQGQEACNDKVLSSKKDAQFTQDCGTEQIDIYCPVCNRPSGSPLKSGIDYISIKHSSPCTTTTTTGEEIAQCQSIKVYDTDWSQLTSTQLSTLSTGDAIRLAVSGTSTTGTIDKAQFTVNGTPLTETTTKKPGTNEFYSEYVIPSGVTSFTITAKIHHSTLGWF